MDPVLCLEHEIRRAQIKKENVVAVFFDFEKAHDMMWNEGLLFKLCKSGITGRMYRWIRDFLFGGAFQGSLLLKMENHKAVQSVLCYSPS